MHSDCCVLINLCTVYIDVGGDCEWSANSYLFFSMKCTVFNFALMRGQRTPICLPHQSFPQQYAHGALFEQFIQYAQFEVGELSGCQLQDEHIS